MTIRLFLTFTTLFHSQSINFCLYDTKGLSTTYIIFYLLVQLWVQSRYPDFSSTQCVEYSLSSLLLPPYWLSSPAYPDKLYSGCAVVFPCVRLPASFPWCPGSLYTKFPARTFSPAGLALLLSLPVATKNVTYLEFLQPGNTIIVNIFVISFL